MMLPSEIRILEIGAKTSSKYHTIITYSEDVIDGIIDEFKKRDKGILIDLEHDSLRSEAKSPVILGVITELFKANGYLMAKINQRKQIDTKLDEAYVSPATMLDGDQQPISLHSIGLVIKAPFLNPNCMVKLIKEELK